jgi:hypothetical protein
MERRHGSPAPDPRGEHCWLRSARRQWRSYQANMFCGTDGIVSSGRRPCGEPSNIWVGGFRPYRARSPSRLVCFPSAPFRLYSPSISGPFAGAPLHFFHALDLDPLKFWPLWVSHPSRLVFFRFRPLPSPLRLSLACQRLHELPTFLLFALNFLSLLSSTDLTVAVLITSISHTLW